MNEEAFQRKLSELIAEIATINGPDDRARLLEIAEQTKTKRADVKTSATRLQDSFDFLRLSIKYLLFDLEATRRENQYLLKMLDAGPADKGLPSDA